VTERDERLRDLVARAAGLVDGHARAVLGICGPPGAGKSGLAEQLAAAFGPGAVVVPMDGFHLQDDELVRLGRLDRKGAPDTFDVGGYAALLRQLRERPEVTVHAPAFDRDRELSLACAIRVDPDHRLVVTEGNYLLLDEPRWWDVRAQLDECWFLRCDDGRRRQRLVDRHVRHGRTPEAAAAWVAHTDEPNARLVAATAGRADLVVDADDLPAWMGR
jgi:pantothenate kinase